MSKRVESTLVCADRGNFIGYSLSLSHDGIVYGFGKQFLEANGEEEEIVLPPKPITLLTDIKSISCGIAHACFLDIDNSVFTIGNNRYGQLGVGRQSRIQSISTPQKLELPRIKQISCGGFFTICLSENGDIFSFGYGESGVLGHEFFCDSHTPTKMDTLSNIDYVESGGNHVCCMTASGDIYSWGANNFGQLATGDYEEQTKPFHNNLCPNNVIDIKVGDSHTLLLTSNNEVYSCGNNNNYQLGRNTGGYPYSSEFKKITDLSEITRIECGILHSMCIDINNNFYVFGSNFSGQLGLGDTNNRNKPIKHPSLSNIIDISKGGWHTFVKTSNNEIYAFGNNKYSQLGIKTKHDNQITPIRVFEDNEDIWFSNINKSKAKSARF